MKNLKTDLLDALNKKAIEEALRLDELKKDNEIILNVPTKAKVLNGGESLLVDTPDVSIYNNINLCNLHICPLCKKEVRLGEGVFITDNKGQRVHYNCMLKEEEVKRTITNNINSNSK